MGLGRSHPDLDDGRDIVDGRATSPRTSSFSSSSSTVTELDRLLMCDDVLRLTLSYLDLPSLIRLASGTSRILRCRLLLLPSRTASSSSTDDGDDVCCCWRNAFEGHNNDDDDDDRLRGVVVDYCHRHRDALRIRLSLWSNLRGGGGAIGARRGGGGGGGGGGGIIAASSASANVEMNRCRTGRSDSGRWCRRA